FNVVGGTIFTGSTTVAPFTSTGTYYDYFTGATLVVNNTAQTIALEPGELRIYTNKQETLPTVPATFDFEDFVGLTPVSKTSNHFVYPTITDQTIYIATEQLPQYVQVYTLRGDLVKLARHTTELNVSDLKSGLYLMVVTFDNTQEAFKFMRK
ncbi:MAG: T9SS type A sorting domain-containing protein, partial [Paludibacteraceae bacterium]|nr:T9SS type A sorting domain-containing protein [Paludibacteraceae bacterium]